MKFQKNNRRGVTLLFVVSMIVLFLLMGTTFVVIANDYFRASRKRSITQTHEVDTTAYVHRSFYNLVRGPELENTNAVLRGHDLLSDMYGYGLKATVGFATPMQISGSPTDRGRRQLFRIQLNTVSSEFKTPFAQNVTDKGFKVLGLRNILADAQRRSLSIPLLPDAVGGDFDIATDRFDYTDTTKQDGTSGQQYLFQPGATTFSPLDVPGYFGGQVLSFVDGPAKGVSARILDYTVVANQETGEVTRSFIILPETLPSGGNSPFDNEDVTIPANSNLNTLQVSTREVNTLGEVRDGNGNLVRQPSTVIINGKPFSGTGAGTVWNGRGYEWDTATMQWVWDGDARVAGGVDHLDTNKRAIYTPPAGPGQYRNAVRPNHARFQGWDYYASDPSDASTYDTFFTHYSQFVNSVNEPYDAFDHDNIFLSQWLFTGTPGEFQPAASFNPVQLSPAHLAENENVLGSPNVVVAQNLYSFRPVLQWDPTNSTATPLASSTANKNFPGIWDIAANTPPTNFSSDPNDRWGLPDPALGPNAVPHEPQSRPLDVDNDLDGVLDSVWIDLGHGVIVTPDGKKVKPMVAPMIVDMDSRLNLNVHGNIADAVSRAIENSASSNYAPSFIDTADLLGLTSAAPPAHPLNGDDMARGYGWGPPEISLAPLMSDYQALLVGATSLPGDPIVVTPATSYPVTPGRYGPDRFPGFTTLDSNAGFRFLDHPRPTALLPGDIITGRGFQGRPSDIHGRFAVGFPSAYVTVPDLANPGSTVEVPYGMPTADAVASSSTWPPVGPEYNAGLFNHPGAGYEVDNSAYESSLYSKTAQKYDLLFTPDELEAVLRPNDVDSQLMNQRLLQLGINPSTSRHLVTTDSWEVPALPPADFTIVERLYEILSSDLQPTPMTHLQAYGHMKGYTFVETASPEYVEYIHSLLAPEIMRGLPMNVNRVFGDGGNDNDGDGVTDEHWDDNTAALNEAVSEDIPGTGTHPTTNPSVGIDHNNDGQSDREDRFARQHFARHLFVLTWLAAGGDFDNSAAPSFSNPTPPDMNGDGGTTADDYLEDIALLAQWCINVCDYRDADSICTPFQYDANPWDGWNGEPTQSNDLGGGNSIDPVYPAVYELLNVSYTPDPGLVPYAKPTMATGFRGMVWGMERPEMLITEVFASHERRYTEHDASHAGFESRMFPKASVFVELYNPWATLAGTSKKPLELGNSAGDIDLTRAADGNNDGDGNDFEDDPVWRMVFTETRGSNPMDADSRRVYFRRPSDDVEPAAGENFFYPSNQAETHPIAGDESAITVDPVPPNGYAIVGSAGVIDANEDYLTTFGRRSDLVGVPPATPADLRLDETRYIKLQPRLDQIEIQDWDTATATPTTVTRSCVVVPINRRGDEPDKYRSLGVSDPTEGYDSLASGVAPDTYSKIVDTNGNSDGFQFDQNRPEKADLEALTYPKMRRAAGTVDNDAVFYDGITPGARYVLLQRLANPQAEFDAIANPYITVDSAPVDLLSFNGIGAMSDPTISTNTSPWLQPSRLDSHERGESNVDSRLLWTEEPMRGTIAAVPTVPPTAPHPPRGDDLVNADSHFLSFEFLETLGEMNEAYAFDSGLAPHTDPFAWFTWNNRPFVSQYELGNVPFGKAGPIEHPSAHPSGGDPPDFDNINLVSADEDALDEMGNHAAAPASALGKFDLTASQVVQFNVSKLKNVFGYLEVPPRFVNSEIGFEVHQFKAQVMDIPDLLTATPTIYESIYSVFNAPHNFASRYRYPGKVNLNTLTAPEIWNDAMMRYWGVPLANLAGTRGDLVKNATTNAAAPAYFGGSDYSVTGPYGPAGYTPVTTLDVDDPIRPNGTGEFVAPRSIPDSTKLAGGFSDSSILRSTATSVPNLLRSGGDNYAPTGRDYAFTNSSVVKLANISTNRSSVFAVWITVGYFEIDESGRLGAEVGTDTGEIKRNRGFYMYDRSIPVAYEPGFNHNIERGILLQSIIE